MASFDASWNLHEMEHQDTPCDAQEKPSDQIGSRRSSDENLRKVRTLPPRNVKRANSSPHERVRRTSAQEHAIPTSEPNYPRSETLPSTPISLTCLATQYKHLLPQQIQQVAKAMAPCDGTDMGKEPTILSANGALDIHLVQSRETVEISVAPRRLFKVPSNSHIKFSLLYPGGERVFCGVRDIIAADPVPKIICTQHVYLVAKAGPMCELSAGEILAPRGELVIVGGYECMEVHSFTTGGKKYLTMDNCSSFTTEENKIGLHLSDLLRHVEGLFPSKVKMLTARSHIPLEEVYTVHSRAETTMLIGTRGECDEIIEIPADDDVDVVFVPQTRESASALMARNRRVLMCMGSGKTMRFTPLREIDAVVSRVIDAQDELYDDVLKSTPGTNLYDYVENVSSKLETNLRAQTLGLERHFSTELPNDGSGVGDVSVLSGELRSMKEVIKQLSNELKELKMPSSCDIASDPTENEIKRRNRRILQTLSQTQVIELLGKMDLSQYERQFASESIDGPVLCELDEAMLEHELGVASKLHRVRLILIISGQMSVTSYIQIL